MKTLNDYQNYLTQNPLKSGNLLFEFSQPTTENILAALHITNNNVGVFLSDYILKDEDGKICIRFKNFDNNKSLVVKPVKENANQFVIKYSYSNYEIEKFLDHLEKGEFIITS